MTIFATITNADTGNGISIQYVAFLKEKAGKPFEKHQSVIFEHFLAIMKDFDLNVFQAPTGRDLRLR
ncbi:MAG: hypothetical protein HC905_05075 [Bacteroidales bacterium]|nr:hypothetical protein [Bacteroidales bacterium]